MNGQQETLMHPFAANYLCPTSASNPGTEVEAKAKAEVKMAPSNQSGSLRDAAQALWSITSQSRSTALFRSGV